jgi:hypothetical protein
LIPIPVLGSVSTPQTDPHHFNLNPYFISVKSNLAALGNQEFGSSASGKSREDLIGYGYNLLTNPGNRRER